VVYPFVVLGQSFPKILLLPVLAVLFEYGMGLTIALVVAGAFFPTFLNTLRGFETAPVEGGELLRSMGSSPRQTFRMFLLPSAMPLIFTGLRHTMTTAFLLTIIGEFAGSQEGLGYLISAEAYALQTPYVYASIVAVSVLAGILYGVVTFAEWVFVTRHR
jgi:NitT/TauT family transport system permease protein